MLIKDASFFTRTIPKDRVLSSHNQQSTYVKQAEQKAVSTVARDGELDVTNIQQRLGRTYIGSSLISILSRLNPNLIFERSLSDPTKTGIYIMQDVRDPSTWSWSRKRVFVCGMETFLNPEYSVIVPMEEEIAGGKKIKKMEKEIRGWRTVIFRLYQRRLLTEPQIESTFKISQNSGQSKHWQERMSAKGKSGVILATH